MEHLTDPANSEPGIDLADLLGCTQRQVAERLGCSASLVSHWATGRKRITAEGALQIEATFRARVTRYQLRPDVFGDAPPVVVQSEAA